MFEGLVRKWITEGLPDLSVSRQRDRLSWGIPVPNDPTHTVSTVPNDPTHTVSTVPNDPTHTVSTVPVFNTSG